MERKEMQQNISSPSEVQRLAVALQLLLSHLIAGVLVLVTYEVLLQRGITASWIGLLAVSVGGLVGLLLTINVLYGLRRLETTLTRFAQGQPAEIVWKGWYWPLKALFGRCQALALRLKEVERNERLTGEYREQLLRQASEAAKLEERNRIARDLHDSIKQQIFSISVSAAAARAHSAGNSADAAEAIADIQQSAKEAQVEMQALLQQLRASPLDQTSLSEALRTQAQALGYRTGAQMHVDIEDLPAADRLPPGTQEAIFRVVQEAFANIARHARASTIWLAVYWRDDVLHVEVRDDGQGFDAATIRPGMGLANQRVRVQALAGSVTIQSAPGQGTQLHMQIPLLLPQAAQQEQQVRMTAIRRAVEQAKSGFQLSDNASMIALGMICFGFLGNTVLLPLLVVCLAMIYGYVQGRYYTARVTIYALDHEDREMQDLWLREYRSSLWGSRVCIMGVWLLFLSLQGWRYPSISISVAALTVGAIVLMGYVRRRGYRGQDRYYAALPLSELTWEVARAWQALGRRSRIWLVALVLFVFFGNKVLAFPPTTTAGWLSYSWIAGISFWGLLLLPDYLQLRRWKHVATERAAETMGATAPGRDK